MVDNTVSKVFAVVNFRDEPLAFDANLKGSFIAALIPNADVDDEHKHPHAPTRATPPTRTRTLLFVGHHYR